MYAHNLHIIKLYIHRTIFFKSHYRGAQQIQKRATYIRKRWQLHGDRKNIYSAHQHMTIIRTQYVVVYVCTYVVH